MHLYKTVPPPNPTDVTPQCPICETGELNVFLSKDVVRMETLLRSQFVFDRIKNVPADEQLKDLTSFAHSASAELRECPRCRVLVRHETDTGADADYVDDQYDPAVMRRLLPRYLDAFRAKERPYRSLLPERAATVEVGPHFGAFLQVAEEWGWRAVGVDIGKDTTRFIRSRGFEICNHPLDKCDLPTGEFDGVFIWNCFEQIPDPHGALEESRRILRSGGVLVLRVPNALYYRVCERALESNPHGEAAVWISRALGYSNLLAFPYLHGYEGDSLRALAAQYHLRHESSLNSELIVIPFPNLGDTILEEQRTALAFTDTWSELQQHDKEGRLTGPWIELIFRRE